MNKKYYIIPIFVPNRGCPHNCIFCDQKKITNETNEITPEFVEKQISLYLSTIDRKNSYVELSFFGGSFTGIPLDYQNRLLKPAFNALNSNKIDDIRLSTRPDYIDEKILKNLKENKVGVIELGVQSMDSEVLKLSERGHTSEDVIAASILIKKFGFKLGLQMMVGLPGDNEEKDLYTADEIIKLKPDFVRIYPALVIKDTYMEYMYNNGLYKPLSVDDCILICKKLYIKFMKNSIPIIRIGLQTTDNINVGKDVVSGPFHPAIRELIESSILNDMVDYIINNDFSNDKNLLIKINPKNISKLYAGSKKYFNNMVKKNNVSIKTIQEKSIDINCILVSSPTKERKMSIYEYLNLVK
jgi:histone acetyltransferase (RNA polymerase elongator complex component)